MRENKTADLVVGIVAAVLIFAAVPAALLVLIGLPDPMRAGDAHFWSGHHGFDGLGVVAWVAWAACCGPLLAAVVRKVRRRDVVATGRAPTPEWLASRIAAAVLAVGSVTLSTGAIAGAVGHGGATARPHPTLSVSAPAPPATTVPAPTSPTATPLTPAGPDTTTAEADPANPGAPVRYTVEVGDSLWSIAERFYDDGSEWWAIAEANLGQTMDDGTRFVDPSLIQPGWVLTFPADPTAAPVTPATAPTTTAATAPLTTPAPATATSARPPMGPPEHPGLAARPTTVAATRPSVGGDGGRRGPERRRGPKPAGSPGPIPLPELAALGVGVVLAAAMARRARRVRHLASSTRSEGEATVDLSEAAAGTAADLVPFEDAPVLAWLEAANHHLTGALNASGRADDAPPARLVRVGSDGVEVRLRRPVAWAPPGWVLEQEGSSWRLPASLELADVGRGGRRSTPWLPVLLPVGTNDDGTWLVPIGPGDCVPVIGPEADALVRTMRMAVESWAWSELVTVTDDPSQVPNGPSASAAGPEVEATLAVVDGPEDGPPRRRVLFVGNPASLSTAAAARCSVVTTLPVPATDLTVTVDATAASLHPLGVTVRPDLLDRDRHAAVSEILAVGRTEPSSRTVVGRRPVTRQVGAEATDASPRSDGDRNREPPPDDDPVAKPVEAGVGLIEASAGPTPLRPGPVDVRLLTAVPRLDGLATALTPKRARRAVELVAYLALHHPEPVTSDRLRTRVLGSADADAAAKTLFNTAGVARRAMGSDVTGAPLFPPATKGSHYRISALVSTDVGRVAALVDAAHDTDDADRVIACLRAALGLVEGEPLARTLSGYSWWQAEGHEQRVAATLVDAACRLVPLATAAGHFDLATWAVAQARLVEPYSEALSRAAMQVAADLGDPDRLRREWQECLRRADELDPGSVPSSATERRYTELCRELPDQASLAAIEDAPRRTVPSAPAAL